MLLESAYGKSRVRLVQLRRRDGRHDLRDLTIAIRFQGQYDESYTNGDNTGVLATDTMKNTVYALAAAASPTHPETFGLTLATHFLDRNPRLEQVRIAHVRPGGLQQLEHCEIFAVELGFQARVFVDERVAELWLRYGEAEGAP